MTRVPTSQRPGSHGLAELQLTSRCDQRAAEVQWRDRRTLGFRGPAGQRIRSRRIRSRDPLRGLASRSGGRGAFLPPLGLLRLVEEPRPSPASVERGGRDLSRTAARDVLGEAVVRQRPASFREGQVLLSFSRRSRDWRNATRASYLPVSPMDLQQSSRAGSSSSSGLPRLAGRVGATPQRNHGDRSSQPSPLPGGSRSSGPIRLRSSARHGAC